MAAADGTHSRRQPTAADGTHSRRQPTAGTTPTQPAATRSPTTPRDEVNALFAHLGVPPIQ
jgi:hypothetical protein